MGLRTKHHRLAYRACSKCKEDVCNSTLEGYGFQVESRYFIHCMGVSKSRSLAQPYSRELLAGLHNRTCFSLAVDNFLITSHHFTNLRMKVCDATVWAFVGGVQLPPFASS